VLLVRDVLGFQKFVHLFLGKVSEFGAARRRQSLEFTGVEPDALAVETDVDADIPRVLPVHETTAVWTNELAVGVEAQVFCEQPMQALAPRQSPNLVLVEEEPAASGAYIDFDFPEERMTLFFAQSRPVLRALPGISDLASHVRVKSPRTEETFARPGAPR